MGPVTATKKMKEEATCSICWELMTEPMSISCGHSYCSSCLEGELRNQRHMSAWLGRFYCPQCEAPFKRGNIWPNKQLKSLIECIKEMERSRCEEHGELLNIFCEDDSQLICSRCERKPQHRDHLTAHVEDVCQGYKEKLQKAVTKLEDLENQCNCQLMRTREEMTTWKENIELQKKRIHSDFENIRIFLNEEERTFMLKLEKEKIQILKRLQDNEANLEKQSLELKNHILELQEKCQGSAQNLLQDVKNTLCRSSAVKLNLPETISLEVQTVSNISELYFDVKKISRN